MRLPGVPVLAQIGGECLLPQDTCVGAGGGVGRVKELCDSSRKPADRFNTPEPIKEYYTL